MFTCFLFPLFLHFSPVLALQFQYGFFHSSHVLLTLSLLCIKRPVIRHKVQFLLHISVQAAHLPAAQSWNQSPNPETLKPSGRVRHRGERDTQVHGEEDRKSVGGHADRKALCGLSKHFLDWIQTKRFHKLSNLISLGCDLK